MELELFDLVKIMRRRLWWIIGLVSAAVLITGCLSFWILEPSYEATATLLVQGHKTSDQVVVSDLVANQNLLTTYAEIITSRQIAQDVLQRLGISLSTEQLLSKVRVNASSESLVTTIAVIDQDPQQAVAIANGFAQSFYNNLNNIMKVDNVAILDQAVLPERPVSPKPYLNMVIALVVSLVLVIGGVLLIEFLDKTVKTEQQVEELLGLPVLGVIGQFDKKRKHKSTNREEVSE